MTNATTEQLIAAKERIRALFAEGELPYVIHLGGGNEAKLIEIFNEIQPEDYVLSGHRSHYHFMLKGGTEDELVDEVRSGHSMHLFSGKRRHLTSSILAGTCGVAAGIAWALMEEGSTAKVWCFIGDGAEDEGAFYEAANFVEGWNLPCIFVIEDNDKQVDTDKRRRRGPCARIPGPLDGYKCIRRYHYTFTEPHCGPGLTTMVKFKPEVIENYLKNNG